ncbi:MAG: 4-hydroxy-tetrahydrodipicolinate synthase [Candidatus Gracilibacteria bacterium]|nr:4-hydroxy-tetrahydrodipicolinate synthase [Candidatus Gracilibacteria bacterium]
MNKKQFSGLWTALITPFKEGNGIDNEIDYEALDKLLQLQIDGKVDGVLLLGTTAENPTLSKEEQMQIVQFAIPKLKGKTKIMVNVGTYSTANSIENIKNFDKLDGIDGYLIVNPYYNKPTQTGLYLHFTTCANITSNPIILYNIKGRTGVNLETETLLKIIGESPNVVGIKEASGNIEQMKEVINKTPDYFSVLSGDDGMTYDLIQNGGDGVISVASNLIPGKMKEFIDACLEKSPIAKELNQKYSEFFNKIFIQTNPLPAKTYLAFKGIIKETFRFPMCEMDLKEKTEFLEFIQKNNF